MASRQDRKSTRLNSSHMSSSYAVFCLKKKNRAEQALRLFADNGIQYVRTHVDVTDPSLTALNAMLEVRERMAGLVDLQIVAVPQEGIRSFPGGQELMEEAIRLGADVVGGIPHFEYTRDDGAASVRWLMELAHFFLLMRHPPRSTLFPYTTLFR